MLCCAWSDCYYFKNSLNLAVWKKEDWKSIIWTLTINSSSPSHLLAFKTKGITIVIQSHHFWFGSDLRQMGSPSVGSQCTAPTQSPPWQGSVDRKRKITISITHRLAVYAVRSLRGK